MPQAGYTAEIESNGNVNLWRVDNFTLLGSATIPGFSLGTWYTLALLVLPPGSNIGTLYFLSTDS